MKNNIFWLIKNSFVLDYKFFKVSDWNFFDNFIFIIKKYFTIIKHFFKKFELGKDFVFFKNKRIYYDSKLGLAGYQSILSRHQKLMKIAGIKNVLTVVDIGANVGFFSLMCSDLFPSCKIFSVEPIKNTFNCLGKNVHGNKNIRIFNYAISNFNGTAKMTFDKNDSAVSMLNYESGNIQVNAKTLDDLTDDNNLTGIDILKIDVETFENLVLLCGKKHWL